MALTVPSSDSRALPAASSASARQRDAPRARVASPVIASDTRASPAALSASARKQAAQRAGVGSPVTISDARALPVAPSASASQQAQAAPCGGAEPLVTVSDALCLSLPTLGLARGDGGRSRSWTGNLLPTPLAADCRPGPEAAAEGRAAGRGVCPLRLSPPTLGLARRRRRRGAQLDVELAIFSPPTSGLARRRRRMGAQLDGEFALYASRRRLRAWP